jgi:carboxylesterase type B
VRSVPVTVPHHRIQIFGESAGAGSVSNHLVQKRSWPLYTRALMQSGPLADWTAQTLGTASKRFDLLAAHANCTGATAAAMQACLRAKSSLEIYAASKGLPSNGLCDWSPVIGTCRVRSVPWCRCWARLCCSTGPLFCSSVFWLFVFAACC